MDENQLNIITSDANTVSVIVEEISLPIIDESDDSRILIFEGGETATIQVATIGPKGDTGAPGLNGASAQIGGLDTFIQFNSQSLFQGSNRLRFDYLQNELHLSGSFYTNITGSQTFLIRGGNKPVLSISPSGNTELYSDLFIIKDYTNGQPVLIVTQSVVQFVTHSIEPNIPAQYGMIWFTPTNFYVGLE